MRAVTVDAFDTAPTFRDDLGEPTPTDEEILVRVHASSANPVDSAIAAGLLKGMAAYDFPVVLGRDYAGAVEQVGANASGYALGDEVYGFVPATNPTVRDGS